MYYSYTQVIEYVNRNFEHRNFESLRMLLSILCLLAILGRNKFVTFGGVNRIKKRIIHYLAIYPIGEKG